MSGKPAEFSGSGASAEEAMQVADTALALAGLEVSPWVHELEARIARGEISADDAVAAVIARYTKQSA